MNKPTLSASSPMMYALYAATMFFYYYAMGVFLSILALYLLGKGIKTTDIAFIISATAIFTILVQPLIGIISDKLQRVKSVIAISMVTTVLTGLGIIYFDHVIWLFILNGLTQSLIIGIMPLYDNLAANTSFSYGSIRFWGSIGFAVSVQVTGLVYDRVSHDGVFVMFALSAVLCVLTLLPLKDIQYKRKGSKQTFSQGIKTFGILMHNPAFILFLVLSFIILGMHYCNIAYMPLLVQSVGGAGTQVGAILLFQTLFEIPVLLYCDKIIEKLSFRYCLLMICALMAFRFFWYSTQPSASAMTMMFFFQALSTCLFFVVSIKVVVYMIDASLVNTALAMGSMLGKGIGALTFQLVGGQMLSIFGISFLYQFLGIIAIIGFLLSWHFKPASEHVVLNPQPLPVKG